MRLIPVCSHVSRRRCAYALCRCERHCSRETQLYKTASAECVSSQNWLVLRNSEHEIKHCLYIKCISVLPPPWSKLLYSELRAVWSFGKRFSRAVDTVNEPDVLACAGGALSARVCTRTRFSSRHRDCNKIPCLTKCAISVAAQEPENVCNVQKVHATADAAGARFMVCMACKVT